MVGLWRRWSWPLDSWAGARAAVAAAPWADWDAGWMEVTFELPRRCLVFSPGPSGIYCSHKSPAAGAGASFATLDHRCLSWVAQHPVLAYSPANPCGNWRRVCFLTRWERGPETEASPWMVACRFQRSSRKVSVSSS
jgi:hypothetical protein